MSTYGGVPIRRLPPGEGGAARQTVWRTRIARDLYEPQALGAIMDQGPTLVRRVAHEAETSAPPKPRGSAAQGFARYVAIRVHYERQRGQVAGYWSCVKDILDRALWRGVDSLTPQQAEVLSAAKVQADRWIARQAEEPEEPEEPEQ